MENSVENKIEKSHVDTKLGLRAGRSLVDLRFLQSKDWKKACNQELHLLFRPKESL